MTPELYQRVREIYHAACQLEGTARIRFVERECSGNSELLSEVRSLLEHHDDDRSDTLSPEELGLRQKLIDSSLLADGAMSDDALRDAIPDSVGRYRILRKIGEGGMGIVFEAEQETPRRRVALKLVRLGPGSKALFRRFQHEAEMLGRLTHEGIARIYEAGIHTTPTGAQFPYLAMELVDGVTLADYVHQRDLSVHERLALFARVCDAIEHAHQNGVIHRDLKPGNVLVEASGQPKVLDFGIARATDADLRTTAQTSTGQLLGTLPYMSPEQVSGNPSAVDTRSDVYALGVMAYEMLAQELPLDLRSSSIVEAASVIREAEPRRLGAISRAFQGDIETIVAKSLAKDRDRRYGSAAEFGADIRRFLNDDPIVARPASTIYHLGKFARRHRGVALGICIAALALVFGSAVAIWQGIEARSAQRIAEQRFADLHGFAESVIIEYPKIKGTEGETRAQEFLNKTTLEYLDGMALDTRGLEPKVLENLALSYSATGDILGRPNGPNLGDPKASLESYLKSVALLDDLVAREPDNVEFKRSLAITCERVGNLYLQNQEYDQALVVVRKANTLKQAVADSHEKGPLDLSYSFNKLGDIYIRMGRREEAYGMYARSLDLRKRLAESKPDDGEIQRGYTVGLNRVADVLLELDREAEALELYEASLQRRVDLATSQPDNAQATMDLAVGHFKHALVLAGVDRLDDAIPAFESARTILQRMADADPGNMTVRAGVAEVSGEMGRVLFEAGRFDAALPELAAYTQGMEASIPEDRMTADMREQLASGHRRRGQVLMTLASTEDAKTADIQQHKAEACTALHRAAQLYGSLGDDGGRVPPELRGELEACATTGDSK